MVTPSTPKLPPGSAPLKPGDKIIGTDANGVAVISRAPPGSSGSGSSGGGDNAGSSAPADPSQQAVDLSQLPESKEIAIKQIVSQQKMTAAQEQRFREQVAQGKLVYQNGAYLLSTGSSFGRVGLTPDEQQYRAKIAAGTATAGDVVSRRRSSSAQYEDAYSNEVNKSNVAYARQQQKINAENKRIIQAQKDAGLDNAEIVNYNVNGTIPDRFKDQTVDPRTGRQYGTMTAFKPSFSQKYSMFVENAMSSNSQAERTAVGLLDVGVGVGESILGIGEMVLHPIDTLESSYKLVFDPEYQAAAGAQIKDTMQNRPGLFAGNVVGLVVGPEILAEGAKLAIRGGQAYGRFRVASLEKVADLDKLSEANKKAGVSYEKPTFTMDVLRDKSAAVFRDSRSSKAGERMSPTSNVQKSKMARNQYYNPKETVEPNKIIQRGGRAAADTRTIEKTAPGVFEVRTTVKSPRGENQLAVTGTSKFDLIRNTQEKNILAEVRYGKGDAQMKRQGLGQRPASQVSTKPISINNPDSDYVLVVKQSQRMKDLVPKRSANPAQDPLFNNPANIDTVQQQLTNKNTLKQGLFNEEAPISKREARFRNKLAELGQKARERQANAKANKQTTYSDVGTFFDEPTSTEQKALARRPKSEIKVSNPRTKLAPTASSDELAAEYRKKGMYIFSDVETTPKQLPGPDVEIIEPQRSKTIKVESVPKSMPQQRSLRPAFRTITATAQSISLLQAQQSRLSQAQSQRLGLATLARVKTQYATRSMYATRSAMKTAQIQKSATRSKLATDTAAREETRQRSRGSPSLFDNAPRNPEKPTDRIPDMQVPRQPPKPPRDRGGKKTPDPFIPMPRVPRLKQPKSEDEGFFVFSKFGGKYRQVSNGSLSKADALGLGSFYVGNSARATFKIVPSYEPVNTSSTKRGNLGDFIKKPGMVFVEKRNRRIKSAGEKQEITMKGINSNKIKGFMRLFGK